MKSKSEFLNQTYYWWLFTFSIIILFVLIRSWSVVEPDLFVSVRAGHEIVDTGHVQSEETWSYTAKGLPWINHEWLSTVVAYGVSLLAPHYQGFFYLRALLMGLCLFVISLTIGKVADCGKNSVVVIAILLPIFFGNLFSRFQMRAELYGILIYSALFLLWLSNKPRVYKNVLSIFLLLLWSNFHSGTVPFGILIYSFFVLGTYSNAKDFIWIVVGVLTWIATPIGWDVYSVIRSILVQTSYEKTGNMDYQPFTWQLITGGGGWYHVIWPPFSAFAIGAYIWLKKKNPAALPLAFKNIYLTTVVAALLTFIAVTKVRALQYQLIFLIPVTACGLNALLKIQRKWPKVAVAAVLLFFWGYFIPKLIIFSEGQHGAFVGDWQVPVESVEFIKRSKPAGNILNEYDFGGYLVAELPEYPVAVDSRETPFVKFLDELGQASKQPAEFAKYLAEKNMNTVLFYYPEMIQTKEFGYTDIFRIIFPANDWAITYFDTISVVLLRRILENQKIISMNEYHHIRPGYPFDVAIKLSLDNPQRTGWLQEARRCVEENPRNTYCLLILSAFAQYDGDLDTAKKWALMAKNSNPQSGRVKAQLAKLGLKPFSVW